MSHFLRDRNLELFEDEMIALGLGGGAVQPFRQQLVALFAGAMAMAVIAGMAVVREPYDPVRGAARQQWAAVQTQAATNQ